MKTVFIGVNVDAFVLKNNQMVENYIVMYASLKGYAWTQVLPLFQIIPRYIAYLEIIERLI